MELNEELQQRIVGYLDKIEQAADTSAGFVAEHAPETVQQFLAYGWWEAATSLAIFVLWFLITCSFYAFLNFKVRNIDDGELRLGVAAIGFLVLAILNMPFLFEGRHELHQLIKITVSPNVYLIEELSKLI